ncbi:MAG: hypothetical protein NVSMB17_04430 [Candidatus Dormibacteria bacterium]
MTPAEAIQSGSLGSRLWFYSNYHCNLACAYCLTDSAPSVPPRLLPRDEILELASDAPAQGFNSFGITGGEPFLRDDLPGILQALTEILPTLVLTNATLLSPHLISRLVPIGDRLSIQVSLDSADEEANDSARGTGTAANTIAAIRRLRAAGLHVRIGTTGDIGDADMERLCMLHRRLGIADTDHVVRPVVSRGRGVGFRGAVTARMSDLPAELTVTADGAFWSPFGPTVAMGRLDTDLLVSRARRPLGRLTALIASLAAGTERSPQSLGIT